jgi:hypothetical protein
MSSVTVVRRRRGVAFIAALALLCAQAIGLAHGVAHPHAKTVAAAIAEHDHAIDAFDAQHDEGSWQCQLFDQLSHGDGVTPSLPVCVFAAPAAALAAAPAVPVQATCACGYHARGPPTSLA